MARKAEGHAGLHLPERKRDVGCLPVIAALALGLLLAALS